MTATPTQLAVQKYMRLTSGQRRDVVETINSSAGGRGDDEQEFAHLVETYGHFANLQYVDDEVVALPTFPNPRGPSGTKPKRRRKRSSAKNAWARDRKKRAGLSIYGPEAAKARMRKKNPTYRHRALSKKFNTSGHSVYRLPFHTPGADASVTSMLAGIIRYLDHNHTISNPVEHDELRNIPGLPADLQHSTIHLTVIDLHGQSTAAAETMLEDHFAGLVAVYYGKSGDSMYEALHRHLTSRANQFLLVGSAGSRETAPDARPGEVSRSGHCKRHSVSLFIEREAISATSAAIEEGKRRRQQRRAEARRVKKVTQRRNTHTSSVQRPSDGPTPRRCANNKEAERDQSDWVWIAAAALFVAGPWTGGLTWLIALALIASQC